MVAMIELQIVCYVVGLALVWAGAPAEYAIGAWGLGFAMVWRPRSSGRRDEPSAELGRGRVA